MTIRHCSACSYAPSFVSCRRFLGAEELGFPDHVRRNFSPLYHYLESPFREQLATPLSAWQVPEEYCNSYTLADK